MYNIAIKRIAKVWKKYEIERNALQV